jgi:hypothetical protein
VIFSFAWAGGLGDFRLFCRQGRLVDIIRTAKLRLTSLSDIFYASSRWLKGIIMAKMRPLPADPQNQITILLVPSRFELDLTRASLRFIIFHEIKKAEGLAFFKGGKNAYF